MAAQTRAQVVDDAAQAVFEADFRCDTERIEVRWCEHDGVVAGGHAVAAVTPGGGADKAGCRSQAGGDLLHPHWLAVADVQARRACRVQRHRRRGHERAHGVVNVEEVAHLEAAAEMVDFALPLRDCVEVAQPERGHGAQAGRIDLIAAVTWAVDRWQHELDKRDVADAAGGLQQRTDGPARDAIGAGGWRPAPEIARLQGAVCAADRGGTRVGAGGVGEHDTATEAAFEGDGEWGARSEVRREIAGRLGAHRRRASGRRSEVDDDVWLQPLHCGQDSVSVAEVECGVVWRMQLNVGVGAKGGLEAVANEPRRASEQHNSRHNGLLAGSPSFAPNLRRQRGLGPALTLVWPHARLETLAAAAQPPGAMMSDAAPISRDERVAVLLAGGLGSRLAPLTAIIPKPLVPIDGEHSIAEIVLRQLARRGFTKVFISIGYLGHLIEAVLGDGSRYGVAIEYVRESTPLGTVGPLHLLADRLPATFLLMNGDVLTDLDFGALLAHHQASGRTLTVAVFPRQVKVDLGVLDRGEDGIVTGFREKPSYDFLVSMGVYAMAKSVLKHIPSDRPFGFDQLMGAMLAAGDAIGTFDWSAGRWLDIGRHDDFATAQARFAEDRDVYLPREG